MKFDIRRSRGHFIDTEPLSFKFLLNKLYADLLECLCPVTLPIGSSPNYRSVCPFRSLTTFRLSEGTSIGGSSPVRDRSRRHDAHAHMRDGDDGG